jgi:hypothetical protein
MKYDKAVLLLVFGAGILVGNNLDFLKKNVLKITRSFSIDDKNTPLETHESLALDLNDGTAFGSEPELVSSMQGCEVKSKSGCSDRVICTGFAEGGSSSKIELLMTQHKAEGIALTEAVQYVNKQLIVNEKLVNDLPVQDLRSYTIIGGQIYSRENLVAIAIGYNCK